MDAPKLLFYIEQPHGLGEVFLSWQTGNSGTLLATTGTDSTIAIFNRYGQLQERIKLPGLCCGMEWDSDGDLLAAISPSNASVTLWECHPQKRHTIDTGLRESPTCIAWAKQEPILAIGTQRGNVVFYNHQTSKRVPVIGKHSKKVTCGAWNSDNILALVAEDKTLSISNSDGDTLRIVSLRDQPNDLQFSEMKTDERVAGENTISLVVGKRTLYLYNLLDPENPIELAFQQKYGSIVSYKWFGDGYILIGFNAGVLIAISTHIKEVGQELFQIKNHKENLLDVDLSQSLGQVATCGDSMLQIRSVWDTSENNLSFYPQGGAEKCSWSIDGQLLGVAGQSSVSVYLTKLAALCGAHNTRALLLTNLTEGTLYQCVPVDETAISESKGNPVELMKITFHIEPLMIAIGPYHICYISNDTAWFYDTTLHQTANLDFSTKPNSLSSGRRQYPGAITNIKIGTEYAATLFEGKVMLHMLDQPDISREDKESKLFPEVALQEATIINHALSNDFLVFITDLGHLQYFALEEWKTIVRYRHSVGLKSIFCDPSATRAIIADIKNNGFVYSPINDNITEIPEFLTNYKGVLWDTCLADRNIFIIWNDDIIVTYYYVYQSVNGNHVELLGNTPLPKGQIPLVFCSGDLYLHCQGGRLNKITLSTHQTYGLLDIDPSKKDSNQLAHLQKLIGLRRYNDAFDLCCTIDKQDSWIELGKAAISNLDIAFAVRVYTHLNDVAMVWTLEDMLDIENISILCARACVCLGRAEAAAAWCAGGGAGEEELALRLVLHQWPQAIELARTVAPEQLPVIQRNHAQHLEFIGENHEALNNYERALIDINDTLDEKLKIDVEDHNNKCLSGLARTSIKCGDFNRGLSILSKLPTNIDLIAECAQLLEVNKQYSQAANLYEQTDVDKAALLCIKLKSWLKVEQLLPRVTLPSIYLQYAKAKESDGRYPDALKAYKMAKDFDSAIRLNLDYLNSPDEAVQLVQETKSIQGAKMVASFFQKLNDYTTAIKFLVMSMCYEEAFQLARQHGKLQLFGEILIQNADARLEDFKSLALHFESEKNSLLAGKFYFHAKEYPKAMSHLLKAASNNTNEDEAISLAIDTIASSNSEQLAKHLIEYLLGDSDGYPKEPKYLFRLYMARKQFQEAAKTALIIANQEQVNGNYRVAHDMLFTMYQELKSNELTVPAEMKASLALLHSYILVRLHLKRGDHLKCANMLIRVAENISLFPSHIVSILTSVVIECQRAGLKKFAHTYARTLMKPEYRTQIDPKYTKKIESVVRHPPKESENLENLTPCPYCGHPIPETNLTCNQCKMSLPFCIATGCHVIKSDLTACSECDFPAIRKEFVALADEGLQCPMCWEKVDPQRLIKIDNFKKYLDADDKHL